MFKLFIFPVVKNLALNIVTSVYVVDVDVTCDIAILTIYVTDHIRRPMQTPISY